MTTTLPPNPSFNPNIPVLSSAGGSGAAYNDPNSPESILKNVHTLNVQSAVDTKYDVAQSPYHDEKKKTSGEGFKNPPPDTIVIFLSYIAILFIIVFLFKKRKRNSTILLKNIVTILCIFLFTVIVKLYINR